MAANYAAGLSEYSDKGKLGLPEHFMSSSEVSMHVATLAQMMRAAKHVVVHTGAGISTAAGIPDFRGPKGIWTMEAKGAKEDTASSLDWLDAKPTLTHMSLAKLVDVELVKFVVSQNIDGLHMRSGLPRVKLAELHGNMFVDSCDICHRMSIRGSATPTVGQKTSKSGCRFTSGTRGRSCRGHVTDFVLDWEHELPQNDLDLSVSHSNLADLNIVLGSTLQIVPSGNLPTAPLRTKKDAKLVIINLQRTKHHNKAHLVINDYVDNVMKLLMTQLDLQIPTYKSTDDPVVKVSRSHELIEWTQSDTETKRVWGFWMEKKKGRIIRRKRKFEIERKHDQDSIKKECVDDDKNEIRRVADEEQINDVKDDNNDHKKNV